MTSTGTAFADSLAVAREPTVTCSANPSVNTTLAVTIAPSTRTSMVCVGTPSASTFSWTRGPRTIVRDSVIVYLPSLSVVAVASAPATVTTAPATGPSSAFVVTTPEIVTTSWAEAGAPRNSNPSNAQRARRVIV